MFWVNDKLLTLKMQTIVKINLLGTVNRSKFDKTSFQLNIQIFLAISVNYKSLGLDH